MAKKEAYKVQEVIDALIKGDGYVSQAAAILGCHSGTVYNYAKRHPTVQTTWDDIKEKRHDFVENAMFKRIKEGSDTMMIWYSKTQMQERGYIEKKQLEHSGEIIKITVRNDND